MVHTHQHMQDGFLKKFHSGASIKPRIFQVNVQFIPLTFRPDSDLELRELEECIGINKGDIVCAKWIKPVSRHSPMQMCGHTILPLTSLRSQTAYSYTIFMCVIRKCMPKSVKRSPLGASSITGGALGMGLPGWD